MVPGRLLRYEHVSDEEFKEYIGYVEEHSDEIVSKEKIDESLREAAQAMGRSSDMAEVHVRKAIGGFVGQCKVECDDEEDLEQWLLAEMMKLQGPQNFSPE